MDSIIEELNNLINESIRISNLELESEIKVGDYVYILGTGHNKNNIFFPKGEIMVVSNITRQETNDKVWYSVNNKYSDEPLNKVKGISTDLADVRKATSIEALEYCLMYEQYFELYKNKTKRK